MKKSKILPATALFAVVLLLAAAFGEARYYNGVSKGFELGRMAAGGSAANEASTNRLYDGPEAWMLNPTGKAPFWTERTDKEALALEVSDAATIKFEREYVRRDLDASVPLADDESFRLDLVIGEEIDKDTLHEMNCYYPKHVTAGETAEIRIVLEEENGKIYVGTIQLTAGDEDLNLVHGSANPNAWYGAHRVDCDEGDNTFTIYFYTGATEEHWERPMFAGKSGYGGVVHCNYHCLEGDLI